MLKISRLDINLPADLVQTCAGVRESQLCKFIATNSQGEFQHSIEVRGKQNNVISLELSNLSISFQDGHFVAEVEQALKVFQGRSETENEAVIPDAHVTSSQNAELESSHSNSGQPPDQVTLQDHYVSQVPMATNVTQGHQPTPEPSPRRLFRNISRKRPAETVTSGATKFPRIIQEERLPSLTSGTTTTALTQQTHSDTKQTEEVSVEESRHDIVEVKVETDDDDYEDLTGAIDDNTGDSANKPSSSYVHSVPMVSQALASQHVVLGHSSSSTGHHTGQHTAVQHSGQAIARRQEQVKLQISSRHAHPPHFPCRRNDMPTPADMFLPSSTENTVQYGGAELAGVDHLETLTFHPDTKPLTDESLNFLTLRILKFSGPLVSVRGLQRTFSSCRTGRMYTAPEVQQAMAHLDMSGLGKILKSSRKVMFAKISPGAVNPHTLQLVTGQSVDEYREHFERCHKQVLAWSDQVKVHVLGLCQKTYGDQYATYVRRLIGCDAPIQ